MPRKACRRIAVLVAVLAAGAAIVWARQHIVPHYQPVPYEEVVKRFASSQQMVFAHYPVAFARTTRV